MQDIILWVLDHLNYWTVTIFMAIESSFIPFPSEVVVPPAAWKTGSSAEMTLLGVVIFATIGANIGALVNYYLAKFLGRPVVYSFARSRWGRYCLIDEAKVKYAEEYFVKNGAMSTFVGRLVPAVRQLISIPAGLAKMNLAKFALFTAIGAGAWNAVLAGMGYYLESFLPEEQLIETVTRYSHEIGYCIFGVVALALGIVIYKGFKK